MNILELFSGTGSVGRVCEELGHNVISVDFIFEATHKTDIMKFNYKQYDKNFFDIVWSSPPCTNYSALQNCWLGKKRKGVTYTKEIQEKEMLEDDKIVKKTLEIINYFNPELWFLENPAYSRMRERDYMQNIPNYIVDYCMYSNWGYRKSTRIWTNKKDWEPLRCDGSGCCGNMEGSIHKINLGGKQLEQGCATTQAQRYRIPENLILSLLLD